MKLQTWIAFMAVTIHAGSSWGAVGFGPRDILDPVAALKEARASKVSDVPGTILADSISGNGPMSSEPSQAVEWISISGGKFVMENDLDLSDAEPVYIHEVTIKTFEMSKTVVTVEQYAECVNKGLCTKPFPGIKCNWEKTGRQRHPINCVDWDQANQYAKFEGARLPSESEWEYAARSEGKNQKYPWGNEDATCERAVMRDNGGSGCGTGETMQVCSKPTGNTEQGLCDMAGNVWQWVQDMYYGGYVGAPKDGSAFESAHSSRLLRGGSFHSSKGFYLHVDSLRVDFRNREFHDFRSSSIGFRLARTRRD